MRRPQTKRALRELDAEGVQPMKLKPIPTAPGYFASDEGHIYSAIFRRNPRPLEILRLVKPSLRPDGYLSVMIYVDRVSRKPMVHHLVLEAFGFPRPDYPTAQVRHLDGTRDNNRIENIKWGTRLENAQDAIGHGTVPRGSQASLARLSESSVLEARELYATGKYSFADLAPRYGVSRSTLRRAVSPIGDTWRHV